MASPETYSCVFLLGPESVEVRRLPKPTPGSGEILVRVEAATTCGTDLKVFRHGGHPRMLQVPTPFGHEMAGAVEATGADVDRFEVGDRVVVVNSAACSICEFCLQERQNLCRDLHYLNGAFAEFVLVPRRFVESSTYSLGDNLLSDLAALTEPLACVMHGLSLCDMSKPHEVLLLGAGPIGLLWVAALATAGHSVEVSDPNPARLAVANELGAARSRVFDRAKPSSDRRPIFDLAIDATGHPEGWKQAVESVRPGGEVLLFGGCEPGSRVDLDTSLIHYDELTLRGVYHHTPAAVRRALEFLHTNGSDLMPILTDRMPFEAADRALRSMMERQNLKVVLEPSG